MIATLKDFKATPTGTVLERLPAGIPLPFGLQDHYVAKKANGGSGSSVTGGGDGSGDSGSTTRSSSSGGGGGGGSGGADAGTSTVGVEVTILSAAPVRHMHSMVKPISDFLLHTSSESDSLFTTPTPTTTTPATGSKTPGAKSCSSLLIPEKTVCRFFRVLDVVTTSSTRSMCFTKAYGTSIVLAVRCVRCLLARICMVILFQEHG